MGRLIAASSAASSTASVHFCPCNVKSSGIALSRSTCAPVLGSSPPSVVWILWVAVVLVPAYIAVCVPLGSSVVSRSEPPFALSLHMVFCGMLMQPTLACAAALQCALGMRVPFGGALQIPPALGSGLRASICATLRMIRDSVRCAWPCTCSAGLFASSLSFVIHWAFFMERFASSLCSIFPLSSTFTPARCKLSLALCASSRSGSCCNGLPMASA